MTYLHSGIARVKESITFSLHKEEISLPGSFIDEIYYDLYNLPSINPTDFVVKEYLKSLTEYICLIVKPAVDAG